MIELNRSKDKKWIFQKNISSKELIESFVKVLGETPANDKDMIQSQLRTMNAYFGRSAGGSKNTVGVRYSQICFYMFGYKDSNNVFIPTQTTYNILKSNQEMSKNMLINLFSIQFPHPYSKTSEDFCIYAGRLIIKLLTENLLGRKLYIDEMIWFLPFIKTIDSKGYSELVESILEYRKYSYSEKLSLFHSIDDYDSVFSNCLHEINYYFIRIFEGFGVFETVEDYDHNEGRLISFHHGNGSTLRYDTCKSRGRVSGFVRLHPNLLSSAEQLVSSFSPFDVPTSKKSPSIFSQEEWISDLYENELLTYMNAIFPDDRKHANVISTLNNMVNMSKYSRVDGRDFEDSLKPVFLLFREMLNVEIISGAGNTDLLCAAEDKNRNNKIYKLNVEAKSRTSANSLNASRINRHIRSNCSKYCIVVAPRFTNATKLDIEGYPIVTITAESLSRYISRECLTSSDSCANFTKIDEIITKNLGNDISKIVDQLVSKEYGIEIL